MVPPMTRAAKLTMIAVFTACLSQLLYLHRINDVAIAALTAHSATGYGNSDILEGPSADHATAKTGRYDDTKRSEKVGSMSIAAPERRYLESFRTLDRIKTALDHRPLKFFHIPKTGGTTIGALGPMFLLPNSVSTLNAACSRSPVFSFLLLLLPRVRSNQRTSPRRTTCLGVCAASPPRGRPSS